MSGMQAMVLGSNFGPKLFEATISANQSDLNLRSWALSNGWNGSYEASITIAGGVYISSTSTSTAALTIDGSWPSGITVTNNGLILGMGGAGGQGGDGNNMSNGLPGAAGGPAISLGVNVTIVNNGTIGGGGGGGGGSGPAGIFQPDIGACSGGAFGGSGGGGGRTGLTNSSGGAGGAGTNGSLVGNAGTAGTSSTAGSGGAGRSVPNGAVGAGGAGGGWGTAGSSGGNSGSPCGGGSGGAGGAAGKAINLNGFTATRSGSGSTFGAVS